MHCPREAGEGPGGESGIVARLGVDWMRACGGGVMWLGAGALPLISAAGTVSSIISVAIMRCALL